MARKMIYLLITGLGGTICLSAAVAYNHDGLFILGLFLSVWFILLWA